MGHAEQRDEYVPRLIKFFDSQNRGVRGVWCGSSYSLAVNDFGNTMVFATKCCIVLYLQLSQFLISMCFCCQV